MCVIAIEPESIGSTTTEYFDKPNSSIYCYYIGSGIMEGKVYMKSLYYAALLLIGLSLTALVYRSTVLDSIGNSRRSHSSLHNNVHQLYLKYRTDILLSLQGPYVSKHVEDKVIRDVVFPNVQVPRDPIIVNHDFSGRKLESEISETRMFDILSDSSAGLPNATALGTLPHILSNSFEGIPILNSTGQSMSRRDTLIVLTICNQLDMTVVALKYLKYSLNTADLLIVDDHSIDGSADYLRRKGYFVLSAATPKGLTYIWNQAYHFGVQAGYKYLIYMNNDVLVPRGAIPELVKDLSTNSVVVPMTTQIGAGHNPIQSIIQRYNLSSTLEKYTYNPRNVQTIQNTIMRNLPINADRTIDSLFNGFYRFNGFMFGINMNMIQTVAHYHPTQLFDNRTIIVGQENLLAQRLEEQKMMPKISLKAFCYHYKSATVGAAKLFQPAETPTSPTTTTTTTTTTNHIRKLGDSSKPNSAPMKKKDIREKLDYYHPEMFSKSLSAMDRSLIEKAPLQYLLSKTVVATNVSQVAPSTNLLLAHHKNIEFYPPLEYHATSNHTLKKRKYDMMVPHPESTSKCAPLNNNDLTKCLVIAIATSDPITNPGAGDIFTAEEISRSLLSNYADSVSEIRFLRRYVHWYDYESLAGVDVLISLLDAYDIAKALSSRPSSSLIRRSDEFPEIKPTMTTIAWPRNWFQRWLTRPYIGNFDLILVSSELAKSFYEDYGAKFGFQTRCVMGCAPLPQYKAKIIGGDSISFVQSVLADSRIRHLNEVEDTSKLGFTVKSEQEIEVDLMPRQSSGVRLSVPIGVLRLATSPTRFSPNVIPGADLTGYDYGFTGSYYNVPRKISEFDPLELGSQYKGVIVGSGWDKANVSDAWLKMTIGSLPYERMPEVYKSVKIVIDDANHVTEPWGSSNSRVYDALATGSLVITNGYLGADEICDSEIPVFHNTSQLTDLLRYYLTHEDERVALTTRLQQKILNQHTYTHRADELVDYFRQYGYHLTKSSDVSDILFVPFNAETTSTAVTAAAADATMKNVKPLTSGFKFNLLQKSATSTTAFTTSTTKHHHNHHKSHQRNLQEIVAAEVTAATTSSATTTTTDNTATTTSTTTDANTTSTVPYYNYNLTMPERSFKTTNRANICIGIRTYDKQAHWLDILTRNIFTQHENSKYKKNLNLKVFIVDTENKSPTFESYLHEMIDRIHHDYSKLPNARVHMISDRLLTDLSKGKNGLYGYDATDLMLSSIIDNRDTLGCDWMMFTNGDNMYNSAWLDAISPYILNEETKYNVVAWDFVTHHRREGSAQQVIPVQMKRAHVDLGSMIARTELFIKQNIRFLPESLLTTDVFARDYFVVNKLHTSVITESIKLIHRVLMFHQ